MKEQIEPAGCIEQQIEPAAGTEQLLTKKQFGKKLNTTERTIDRWEATGVLPEGIKVKIGGSVRYRESVADAWIAAGCPGTEAQ